MRIESTFDSGNIRALDVSDPTNIKLEIAPDGAAAFFQWFYFRLTGAKGRDCVLKIENAAKASYVPGWKDYKAVMSYDRKNWRRIDTRFDAERLEIQVTPEHDSAYFAYFAPYPTERYRDYVAAFMVDHPAFNHRTLGATIDGQSIDLFTVGAPAADKPSLWVIARQHPGETMGSWWIEGFLERLADEDDASAQTLRRDAVTYIIPCMNLDGVRRGHLRTNAVGVDLNRAWRNTTKKKSPEVFLVREEMRRTGVNFFLDVHGDEAIPNNFLDAAVGIPTWNEQHADRFKKYSDRLLAVSDDFQDKDGYPAPAPGAANLDIATNYVAETWGCLAMTLEMPFKDAAVNPEPTFGWSPDRCRTLGRDCLQVMADNLETFR